MPTVNGVKEPGSKAFGPKVRETYLKAIEAGKRPYQAAARVGIANETLRRYRKAHPEFEADIKNAEAVYLERIAEGVMKAAEEVEPWAAKFVLERRGGEDWQAPKDRAPQAAGPAGSISPAELTGLIHALNEARSGATEPPPGTEAHRLQHGPAAELPAPTEPALEAQGREMPPAEPAENAERPAPEGPTDPALLPRPF